MSLHQRFKHIMKMGGRGLPLLACGLLSLCLPPQGVALGSSINYGNLDDIAGGGSTMYLQVTETPNSQPPPPGGFLQPEVIVNKLDFDPKGFSVQSIGGTPGITDVQLNFTIMTVPDAGITSLLFSEGGDFSLFGGTDLTKVIARLIVDIDILQVDGVNLLEPIEVQDSSTFEVDSTTADPDDPFWANSLSVDLGSILTEHDIDFGLGVTKAKVAINDQLIAFSEPSSIAFIAKKDFMVRPGVTILPEPATLLLACFGLVAMALGSYATQGSW